MARDDRGAHGARVTRRSDDADLRSLHGSWAYNAKRRSRMEITPDPARQLARVHGRLVGLFVGLGRGVVVVAGIGGVVARVEGSRRRQGRVGLALSGAAALAVAAVGAHAAVDAFSGDAVVVLAGDRALPVV